MKQNTLKALFFLLILNFTLILLGGPGYRLGLWGFRTGLGFVLWSAYVAPIVAVLSLILIKGALRTSLTNIVLSLVLLSIPLSFKSKVNSVPRIHDITTDTEDPPSYLVIGSLRGTNDHPISYDKKENAEAQKTAYPDIKTLDVPMPQADAFMRAKKTVEKLGWAIALADESKGQIEATYTSLLYGFKDDVAIRIRTVAGNTQMDIRSQSRVGISDLGANAARIRQFKKEFDGIK